MRIAAYATLSGASSVQTLANGKPALLFWPDSKYLKNIVSDPRMRNIVTAFLGPHTRQINNQVYFREGGDGDQFAWHQDVMFRTPARDFWGVQDNYLQTIICIDPMTPENGAIEFIPGSHKWGDMNLLRGESDPALRKFVRGAYAGIKVRAYPGDVIVWHPLVVHGSEPNITSGSRMTFMNGFAAEHSVLNKEKYPIYE